MDEAAQFQEDGQVLPPLLVSVTAHGASSTGAILSVSSEVVVLGFPPDATPDLAIDDTATLTFVVPRDGGSFSAHGRLMSYETFVDRVQYRFRFESVQEPPKEDIERSELEDATNRRLDFRVKGDPTLAVMLRPFGSGEHSVLRQLSDLRLHGDSRSIGGWLFDISSKGVGILIEDRSAHVFEIGDSVAIGVNLPPDEDSLELAGKIRHRQSVRIGTRYGIVIDAASLREMQRDLLEFVMFRQREELRRRAS